MLVHRRISVLPGFVRNEKARSIWVLFAPISQRLLHRTDAVRVHGGARLVQNKERYGRTRHLPPRHERSQLSPTPLSARHDPRMAWTVNKPLEALFLVKIDCRK